MTQCPQLVLGTAQLGKPYGIAGPDDGVSVEAARDILHHAWEEGIRTYDTAPGYGDSEVRLGEIFGDDPQARIITKLKALDPRSTRSVGEQVRLCIEASLQRLQRGTLYALLVHRVSDLLAPHGDAVWGMLEKFRADGRIGKLGISVYCAEEIDALLPRYPLEVIQVPLNIIDQRLLASGHLQRLRDQGVEIHLRSLFLQGVLLLEERQLPNHFRALRPTLDRLRGELAQQGLKPLSAALGFARSLPQVSGAVVGVDSIAQFDQVLTHWHSHDTLGLDFSSYADNGCELLDPSRWPRREQLRTSAAL